MIQKQSLFSRALYNEAKRGAYYTDVEHCRRIGKLFRFTGEVCVLEPCIGDGKAVENLLEYVEKGGPAYVFGVEIDEETFRQVKEEPAVEYCLSADFLTEVKITPKSFSFCFANPPYMATGENRGERMEQRFVNHIFGYMKSDGYLVLVISFPTICDENFSRELLSRFSCEGIWRFDEKEYEKFKQIVFIGRRRQHIGMFASEYRRFMNSLKLEMIPFLPKETEEPGIRYEVLESKSQNIDTFMETHFKAEQHFGLLTNSALYGMVGKRIFLSPYVAVEFGRPPLPLKTDLMYLAATAGGGQGIVGTEEDHDIHLQRGVAKVVGESSVEVRDDGERMVEKLRTYTRISLNIIENDGTITVLD